MHPQITPDRRPRPRVEHLDDLKVLVIAGVIVVHTAITFGSTGDWYLAGLDEHLTRVGDVTLSVCVIAGALVGMGLLFLIAGVLTPPALAHKGPRRFARDRLLRQGTLRRSYWHRSHRKWRGKRVSGERRTRCPLTRSSRSVETYCRSSSRVNHDSWLDPRIGIGCADMHLRGPESCSARPTTDFGYRRCAASQTSCGHSACLIQPGGPLTRHVIGGARHAMTRSRRR